MSDTAIICLTVFGCFSAMMIAICFCDKDFLAFVSEQIKRDMALKGEGE